MNNHIWRPLYVVLALVAVILLVRAVYVPKDFGVHGGEGYMYGWYREGNVQEWKEWPSNYRTQSYCAECHFDQTEALVAAGHAAIQCENCHGPALDHPNEPAVLTIDRGRDQCLRCHARLPYPGSDRKHLPGIEPDQHNPGMACVDCHNPHNPSLEDM
ncbi:cytochrome c3 family protein [Geoalkalibacter halelectricus]|uniref:Cytochrome c3 family protein n=1 Tax=Geoalkalibacter halelectricus TaxID=2847045 RepID=A0ABY5ZH45_9BACT|nr:cytochrome c3 family protein [Geoalkalibacter halelectricus]MDO3378165.1 cytochrome c3 family protein [Geoalkalibacter halelectricus]UWZ78011.1 cytochrome c3 family protein [Geoalkalibacter halelectricus]